MTVVDQGQNLEDTLQQELERIIEEREKNLMRGWPTKEERQFRTGVIEGLATAKQCVAAVFHPEASHV